MSKITIKILSVTMYLSAFLVVTCSKPLETPVVNNVETQTYKSIGVVKSVDLESGKVKVDHEDIPGYMSPMEMNEPVADRHLLDGIKAGDKVEFEILREGIKIAFTKFTKVGEITIMDGSEIYKTNCAECHGPIGEGAKNGIPLTSGHALNHSETEYIEQVKNGEGKKMPPFKDRLTEAQIVEVVKFVRTTVQADVTPENRGHHH